MKKPVEYAVGQRVKFKAAGKVARLEGMSGKVVTATVTSLTTLDEGFVSVMADYRMVPGQAFFEMGTSVPVGKLSPA